jgi:hypothetical protein
VASSQLFHISIIPHPAYPALSPTNPRAHPILPSQTPKEKRTTYVIPITTFPSALPKKSFQVLFPPNLILSISIALNASIVILLTKLICTPSPLCTPAQLKQIKMPNLGDAHCGDGAPQSQQRSFWEVFWISRSFASVSLEWKGGREKGEDLGSGLGIYLPHGFARHACVCFLTPSFLSFLVVHSRRLPPNKQIDQFKQPMRNAQKSTMSSLQFESRSIKNRSSRGVLYCSGECLDHKGGLDFGGFGFSAMHTNDDAGRG